MAGEPDEGPRQPLIPRHPPCPVCGPHEAHILPCECGCTTTHPYGVMED